ncbi:MAG: preprotein translocase subunit SecY, partial [Candidatus Hodarchaeales archaeon]
MPGIDYSVLKEFVSMPGVRLANVMPRVSIFALGVMPFLSMHVIAVLLCAVAPFFKNIVNEGAAGVKKINNFIYGGTILLSLVQSIFLSMWIENPTTFQGLVLVSNPGVIFRLITMLSLTAGVLVIILMGQMINKYGIGNGISLFLLSLILFRLRGFFPQMVR